MKYRIMFSPNTITTIVLDENGNIELDKTTQNLPIKELSQNDFEQILNIYNKNTNSIKMNPVTQSVVDNAIDQPTATGLTPFNVARDGSTNVVYRESKGGGGRRTKKGVPYTLRINNTTANVVKVLIGDGLGNYEDKNNTPQIPAGVIIAGSFGNKSLAN